VGRHLGSLAGEDLAHAARAQALGQAAGAVPPRAQRRSPRELVALGRSDHSHERDSWQLAWRNLVAERRTLASVSTGSSEAHGPRRRAPRFKTRQESYEKRRRLQHLRTRLAGVERRLEDGRVSICGRIPSREGPSQSRCCGSAKPPGGSGGRRALFICADGEAGQLLGHLTVAGTRRALARAAPPEGLEHLANRPGGRYRLSCPVVFAYRGEEVAAQPRARRALRRLLRPGQARWYLDACGRSPTASLARTWSTCARPRDRSRPEHGHSAVCVPTLGNPIGAPVSVPLELTGLKASTRTAESDRPSPVCSPLAHTWRRAVVIEDLDFVAWREEGRERSGRRPHGASAPRASAASSRLPTGKFRDRLVQMAGTTVWR